MTTLKEQLKLRRTKNEYLVCHKHNGQKFPFKVETIHTPCLRAGTQWKMSVSLLIDGTYTNIAYSMKKPNESAVLDLATAAINRHMYKYTK